MEKEKWSKKDKIACSVIFAVAIITFVVFFSTITLSYFFDTHEAFDDITAGSVSIVVQGGPNNDGQIKFPEVLTPNTQYKVEDYMTGSNYDMMYRVQNKSTSGAVFVMLKLESNYLDLIRPSINRDYSYTYWVCGTNYEDDWDGKTEYLYYMSAIGKDSTTNWLCKYWQVGNFERPLSGSQINMSITAYAVQAQGGAVLELIDDGTDGWQYAPQIFIDMVEAYAG